ncbi:MULTISPECIES: GNAT family N-acetyltransferase [Micrococcus]|uniref:GNAT family N-acetyltransferase n=1 Tax=Micrococcus TaxID=1269 RepID=UPI00119CC128|nr:MULTISPECIES: GNAT family protein [Micrococcus]MCC0767085.1 GNAT family N-acetyltransferase [Micrococcus luteus]MCK6109594.1 GNAT family N-acetyltransferase [Micrococcus luteus]MCV7739021.1 GNAT family N-acetyltransferase [Micrococcus luteus]
MTGSAPVQLRLLRATDAPAVLAAFHAGTVGMADPAEVTDEASARAYVDGLVQAEGTDAIAVVERGTDTLIGLVAVVRDEAHGTGALTAWLHQGWRGDAIMSRAATTVADAELAEGGLERIALAHRADSPTAGAVARAAGLRHEGTQRGRLRAGGRRLDVHRYGRLATDPLPEERVRPLPWASDARPWADR